MDSLKIKTLGLIIKSPSINLLAWRIISQINIKLKKNIINIAYTVRSNRQINRLVIKEIRS